MIPMRLREVTSCPEHHQTIILLEDLTGCRTLAVAADSDESQRLAREVSRRPDGAHPMYDFLDGVLQACAVTPVRVVLEYSAGAGLGAAVTFRRAEGDVVVPCYLSDGVALAQRAEIPVYVTAGVFSSEALPPSDEAGELTRWLECLRPSDFSSGSNDSAAD